MSATSEFFFSFRYNLISESKKKNDFKLSFKILFIKIIRFKEKFATIVSNHDNARQFIGQKLVSTSSENEHHHTMHTLARLYSFHLDHCYNEYVCRKRIINFIAN